LSLPAGGYVHLEQDAGFGLSRDGEELALSYLPGTSENRIVDAVSFKAQEEDVSLGRYPDGVPYWLRLAPSPGRANASPVADVVITEIMYHPADANEEYVELYNPTGAPVALENAESRWRLAGAVEYTFDSGVSLAPGGRLVVVGFDPAVETTRLAAFVAAHGGPELTAGVDIVGPWEGNLSNRGERLALEKPQASESADDLVGWVIVDEVIYSDVSPWPAGADGQGAALERIHADEFQSGNDPANWQAAIPSPGLISP
jgi:hypothetical protein